ncbi:hypothetical protein C1H76_8449 [Elsinoe australis]|uniref:Uncharacterized protein n=1 Tax=Elsinoe australis TaxID=40998 RepID=A0A4U7AUF5_9PEZI|nr:hypothetical protein C1H76_8449 [Elsinoe australis]
MHTTRRPVPSKAALKALRKLAYVASGTACGAAAIVYEERRRRIHFFKQVAENGRIIRSFADKRRNHATAAAVLQDYDSFDAVQHGGWSVQDPHPTHARRRRSRSRALDELENSEGTWLEGAHDEYLPSQVERGYDQISSTKTPNVLRRDDEGGRRRQGDKPSANASDFSRQRQRHDHSRYKRVRVGHQQQGVETGHYNSRNPPQRQVETSLDRVGKAIELWSGRFAQLSGPNPDMTKSWRTVLTAVAENDGAQVEDLIREATSARALVMVALRLHLPDLLLQICRYTCEHDTTPVVAYQITSRLLATRQTSLTASTRDFLLEWLESGATGLIVYDAILRITKEADLSLEHSLIEKHWKRLVISTSNTTTITKVVQAAQNNQWDTVKAQIPELKIEGFVTMQTQQRMHTFDPVFEAFGTPNCDVKELWSLAVTLCNQLSSTPSPDQVLALVSASLIRSGKIEALSRLRAWSSNALDRPLRLTPIDAFDHLRSYYYSFRPSTAVLADLMHKLFKDAWSMVSRLCIPLLDISAAYETKWNQQKRVAAQNQDLVRNALMQIDDPAFREQTTQQITARDSETIEELSMTVDEFTIRKKSGPLVFEIMSVRGSRAPDAENKSQPTAPSTESPQSHHCSDRSDSVKDKRSKPLHKINPVVETETTATETHVIRPPAQGASSAYFSHSKTKALMHDSNSRGDHQSTVDLLEAFSSSNLYTPGPTLASLGMDSAASLSPDLTNAIKQQAELAGGDTSLARLTQLISSLSSSEVDKSKLGSETLLSELKDIVSSEYERLSDHGHLVNHSVATAVANLLLSADQPTAAIELLRHALKLPQTAHASPGSAPMLSLLKAYIQLGRIDGVRWVAGHMFAHNERIEKSFITALKAGQGYWSRKKGLPRTARQKLVSELELVQRLCLAKKEEQIRASWDVGNQLVKYITDNSQKLPMEDSKPLGEQSKEWVDAVIVESVCRDIMIYAQRNKYGSKVPREVDHPEHLRIKGVMERLEQRRSEVEAAA